MQNGIAFRLDFLVADKPDESNIDSNDLKDEADNQKLDADASRAATFDQFTAGHRVAALFCLLNTDNV